MEPASPRLQKSFPVPTDDDGPARRHWGALTIAVAWELVCSGTRMRPSLLRAAREHAAWRVPATAGLAETEAVATAATREFLVRRRHRYERWVVDPDLDILPDPRWRAAVLATATPIHEALFRLHFGDGVPLDDLSRQLNMELHLLRPVREAVRELVRAIVAEDGVPTEGWEPARVDRLVVRVALAAADRCPGPGGLATDIGHAHGEACPRCGRALRLIREGALAASDLFAPDSAVPPPNTILTLVQVHADGRKHIAALLRALPGAVRVSDDQLVVALDDAELAALGEQAERGAPARETLRVVRDSVPGRIVDGVVIGGALDSLREAAQILPFGQVRGLEPLPPRRAPAPSAVRWWVAAALVATLALAAAVLAGQEGEPPPHFSVRATRDASGVIFDTADEAFVDVFALAPNRAEVLFHSTSPADKAVLATRDGRYRADVDERPVIVIASTVPILDAATIVAAAQDVDDARVILHSRYPEAAIVVIR